MKNKIITGLGIIGLFFTLQHFANADDLSVAPSEGNPPGTVNLGSQAEEKINQRQENQEKRIEQGAENGALTEHEKARLEKQQGRIQKAEDKALSDGKMTKREAKHINRMQNNASKNVFRKKHNGRQHR